MFIKSGVFQAGTGIIANRIFEFSDQTDTFSVNFPVLKLENLRKEKYCLYFLLVL